MPPSCALLGGFAIGARVALLWQHNANPSYKLVSIPRYDNIVRTLGGVCARCWPVTGRRRGVVNITAVAWTAGFQWWHSGDVTRTQNVSEYMLVLAVGPPMRSLHFSAPERTICECIFSPRQHAMNQTFVTHVVILIQ